MPDWLKELSPYLAIISSMVSAGLAYYIARGKTILDAQKVAIESTRQANQDLRKDIEHYRDEIRELRAQIDALEDDRSAQRKRISELEDDRSAQRKRISELEAEVARLTRRDMHMHRDAPAT